jgi:23S rRNA (cytosine1962-C5)-methyltransferase
MHELLVESLRRREPIAPPETDALRLVDGAADGFPDLEIDGFAGRWLAATRHPEPPSWLGDLDLAPLGARSIYWKHLDAAKAPPRLLAGSPEPGPFVALENGLRFEIDFGAGYSQGLFLDQRDNRAMVRRLARPRRSGPPRSLLNLFAYTCAFGVAAAASGAATTNVDLSNRYLDWGRRNYGLNGIDPGQHEFLKGDAFSWMQRLARRGRRFDVIVLDPPTFSRDEKGRVFTVEKGFPLLVEAAVRLLAPEGSILASTNRRSLSAAKFEQLLLAPLDRPFDWHLRPLPMPPDFPGEPYLKSVLLTPPE